MKPENEVKAFNAKVKVGDEVDYRSHPGADPVRHKTTTPARILSGHTAVVWLEGKAACVACRACSPA